MAANSTVFDTTCTISGLESNTTVFCHLDKGPSSIQIVIEVIFLIIICVAGTFGNLLVIIAVATTQSLRTVANYFIFVLAGVDLMNTGILVPLFIFTLIKGEWPLNSVSCTVLGYLTIFCIATSEITLTLLAGTRYLIVTKPKSVFDSYFKVKFVILYLIALLVFELTILTIPLWSSLGRVGFNHIVFHCTFVYCYQQEWWYAFILYLSCMVVNLVIIPTFYLLTFRAVTKSKRTVKALQAVQGFANDRNQLSLSPQEIQLTKKLLLLFLVFIVCWFPNGIVIFADSQQTVSPMVHQVTNLLIWLSSGLNPYIYAFRIHHFRKAFKRILTWPWKKCRSEESRRKRASVTDHFGTSMPER